MTRKPSAPPFPLCVRRLAPVALMAAHAAVTLALGGCDRAAHEHGAPPTEHERGATPTEHEHGATPTEHEHGATPTEHEQAGHGAGASPTLPSSPAANPVQAEMRLLTTALEGAVRGIGLGDVRGVEHELHRVHAARATTEAALHDGSYRPPSHGEELDRFVELDEAFHAELERLAEASARNDVPATSEALGSVMSRCQGCHDQFRSR